MNALRTASQSLLAAYVPSDTGSAQFSEIIGGDYGGVGTTCGFLVSWLFHRLGCNDGRIINRTDPAHGLVYAIGQNMTRLLQGAQALGAYRTIASGAPQPGDGIFFSNGPSNTEHVAVCVDASTNAWRTADAGIRNNAGQQCARYSTRTFDPKGQTVAFSDGARKVAAIYNLDKICPAPSGGSLDFGTAITIAGFVLPLLKGHS